GRGEGVDQPPHRAKAAAVQRVGQQAKLARGLVVADGFGHARLQVGGGAATGGARRVMRSCAALSPAWVAFGRSAGYARAPWRMLQWPCCAAGGDAARRVEAVTAPAAASVRCRAGRVPATGAARAPAARPGRSRGSRGAVPATRPDAG